LELGDKTTPKSILKSDDSSSIVELLTARVQPGIAQRTSVTAAQMRTVGSGQSRPPSAIPRRENLGATVASSPASAQLYSSYMSDVETALQPTQAAYSSALSVRQTAPAQQSPHQTAQQSPHQTAQSTHQTAQSTHQTAHQSAQQSPHQSPYQSAQQSQGDEMDDLINSLGDE